MSVVLLLLQLLVVLSMSQASMNVVPGPNGDTSGPSYADGEPVPQVLAKECKAGDDIRLAGMIDNMQILAPYNVTPFWGPTHVALTVIDLQPLFRDGPWGCNCPSPSCPCGVAPTNGPGSCVTNATKASIPLVEAVKAYTGNPQSVIFTQFITAKALNKGKGSWKHYYSNINPALNGNVAQKEMANNVS